MRDLLVILNPRRIDECIQSYRELDIDRLWIRNMSESGVDRRWPEVMAAANGYDRLIIVSDDAVVRQHALDAVIALLDEGHPVVTGYGNLDSSNWRVNLNKAPLVDASYPDSYDFYTLGEVLSWPDRVVPSTVVGFALTGMAYRLWERFPFQAHQGSDWSLSKRLTAQGIPMVGAREGFIWHVKEAWGRRDDEPRKQLLVNKEPASIDLETRVYA
jgi:hypothetical protein